ncbi:hypothetical protein [Actinoplanes regularis]|uniref:Uncharacterized protein n=1 Tax=Actinoplanes regularis TaxID=52697 RepID=A0A239B1R4_9ACTN|nr:hypothetical protein [Actinoplanes regularis]GIE87222.1 hypothetical protein Are01nite_37020 [Actinoplanes regularis]SNS01561.1 hypothetical protein SAMN06264365_108263 [Actinoplanes regularis]
MSPHTRYIPLTVGALLLTAACASRTEQPLPAASASLPAAGAVPSMALPPPSYAPMSPGIGWPTATYAYPTQTYAYPTATTTAPTAAPLTKSPTPTPTHAAKCTGQPKGAEILTVIKGEDGIPDKTFQVKDGPFCSGTWAFTTVKLAGSDAGDQEPLMVVTIGKGNTLTVVAAGSDVCNAQVQSSAPAGIRVLACGF